MGVSTLRITGDAHPQIICAEINATSAAASAMLFILHGYKDIHLYAEDSISTAESRHLQGNKLFVDPPLAARIEKSFSNSYTDLTLAALNRVLHDYLTGDGEAIVVVPSGPLFQGKAQAASLREEMVLLGMIKAVISLPPMWYATTINTNLLFISKKDMPRADVLFIDATQGIKKAKYRGGAAAVIPSDLIDRICEVVEKREEVEGFSRLVHQSVIQERDFNLAPSTYVTSEAEDDNITMEEIDAQLKMLYHQLAE